MADLPRRSVLIGAALCPLATPLAGCSKTGDTRVQSSPSAGQVITPVADVPVGQARIVDGTLITQPSAGVFKGFVARCTHAGCALKIEDGAVECPCHGSKFNFDGSVANGPATEPLNPRAVTVSNGEIVVAEPNSSAGDSAEPVR